MDTFGRAKIDGYSKSPTMYKLLFTNGTRDCRKELKSTAHPFAFKLSYVIVYYGRDAKLRKLGIRMNIQVLHTNQWICMHGFRMTWSGRPHVYDQDFLAPECPSNRRTTESSIHTSESAPYRFDHESWVCIAEIWTCIREGAMWYFWLEDIYIGTQQRLNRHSGRTGALKSSLPTETNASFRINGKCEWCIHS